MGSIGQPFHFNRVTIPTQHCKGNLPTTWAIHFQSDPSGPTSFENTPVPKQYVGHLSAHDPLHPYLVHDVLPQIGVRNGTADFRVFSMKDKKVYLYEERHSCAQVVGK